MKAPADQAADVLRSMQLVRARIAWSTHPGMTIPVVAVSRISGQFFAFVAEQQDGKTVARQRPLQLGEITGNDYTVAERAEGRRPGGRLRRPEPGRRRAHQDRTVAAHAAQLKRGFACLLISSSNVRSSRR